VPSDGTHSLINIPFAHLRLFRSPVSFTGYDVDFSNSLTVLGNPTSPSERFRSVMPDTPHTPRHNWSPHSAIEAGAASALFSGWQVGREMVLDMDMSDIDYIISDMLVQ